MNEKRTRLEIIKDVLNVIREKNGRIKKTHILYKSNLSHLMLKSYLGELIEKSFITESVWGNNRTYLITERGIFYLEKYDAASNIIKQFDLNTSI